MVPGPGNGYPISLGGSVTAGGLNESANIELGQSANQTITMNDTNVRTLAGVSTTLNTGWSMSSLYGKSNRVTITYTFSTQYYSYTLGLSALSGYSPGKTDFVLIVPAGVVVRKPTISGSLTSGDTITLIVAGIISGFGGEGGGSPLINAGAYSSAPTSPGGYVMNGEDGLFLQYTGITRMNIILQSGGAIGGGGGGGGAAVGYGNYWAICEGVGGGGAGGCFNVGGSNGGARGGMTWWDAHGNGALLSGGGGYYTVGTTYQTYYTQAEIGGYFYGGYGTWGYNNGAQQNRGGIQPYSYNGGYTAFGGSGGNLGSYGSTGREIGADQGSSVYSGGLPGRAIDYSGSQYVAISYQGGSILGAF